VILKRTNSIVGRSAAFRVNKDSLFRPVMLFWLSQDYGMGIGLSICRSIIEA
jgi:phosphoglycerate-specific signal transduction histidine kinase